MVKKSARKGKRIETSPPAAEAVAPPVHPPKQQEEQREDWYTPELAEWSSHARPISLEDGWRFEIREIAYDTIGPSPIDTTGPLVAVVTVSHEFGKQDAAAIARLMACAPSLYKALKQVAPNALNDEDGLLDFNEAVMAMFEAVDHYPYRMPSAEFDEDISLRLNECRGKIRKYRA